MWANQENIIAMTILHFNSFKDFTAFSCFQVKKNAIKTQKRRITDGKIAHFIENTKRSAHNIKAFER